ncbi:hypothetical protein FGO68_gene13155 [Halteria grandinella]|uniref:Uncharacterized protein n=1 Tax=Halteria grandinella TaxID=5974 RepID=A0A8J8NCH9_HALGN|nr:hypothetical protein FGO68_gene13155 [Halteria grandinella]
MLGVKINTPIKFTAWIWGIQIELAVVIRNLERDSVESGYERHMFKDLKSRNIKYSTDQKSLAITGRLVKVSQLSRVQALDWIFSRNVPRQPCT